MTEDRKARVDRELIELLNELRVVLPGAQVLFAFLLVLPFTTRVRLTDPQRDVYFAAFLCTAIGTALLMAPSANHRLRFREYDKERMLFLFNRLTIAGTGFLAAAISLVVYVVADVLFAQPAAGVIAGAMAGWIALIWYVLPLLQRRRRQVM
jgi:hypothetical protein